MFKEFLVFIAVIGLTESVKCYDYRQLWKSEFTSATPTCDSGTVCGTATYGDNMYSGCFSEKGDEKADLLLAFTMLAGFMDVEVSPNDTKVEFCKRELCNKPTAVAVEDGKKCHVFAGKKSEPKATKCNHGSQCLIGTVGDFVSSGCSVECSDSSKKMAEKFVLAVARKGGEVDKKSVKVECCNEDFCDSKFLSADGIAGKDLTKVKETTHIPAPTPAPTPAPAPTAAPTAEPNVAPTAAPVAPAATGSQVQCHLFSGTENIWKEKAQKCDGGACVTGHAKDYIYVGCVADCSDESKQGAKETFSASTFAMTLIGGSPIKPDEVTVTCCTENLCNGAITSLFSLLPFTLALLSIVYSMQ